MQPRFLVSCIALAALYPHPTELRQVEAKTPLSLTGALDDLEKLLPNLSEDEVVPDVIPEVPPHAIAVFYPYVEVLMGNHVHQRWARWPPKFYFHGAYDKLYTLLLVCPDVARRKNSTHGLHLLWLLTNVKEDNHFRVSSLPLESYVKPSPGKGIERRRYVFLLYEQSTPTLLKRPKKKYQFDLLQFVRKNRLVLWAANYFVMPGSDEQELGRFDQNTKADNTSTSSLDHT